MVILLVTDFQVYSLMGVHGMLVVPNCWDVGTWGWLERKIESLFYEWTHLYMDLEDIMVILPYKWTFSSMHLESYHHLNGFWKKKEDIGIWKWEDSNQHVKKNN